MSNECCTIMELTKTKEIRLFLDMNDAIYAVQVNVVFQVESLLTLAARFSNESDLPIKVK